MEVGGITRDLNIRYCNNYGWDLTTDFFRVMRLGHSGHSPNFARLPPSGIEHIINVDIETRYGF